MQVISKSLPMITADAIISFIIESDLSSGDKLPVESEFSRLLGVGRGTFREAIKILISRNIVDVKRGSGTFVALKPGIAEDPLGLTFINDKIQLAKDLIDVRMMIEPNIAAKAAQNATEKEREELKTLCDEVERLIVSGQDHTKVDIDFHLKLAECSKNLVLPNLVPVINSAIMMCITTTEKSLLEETIETHRQVVDAVLKKDPVLAFDAMYLHLVYNRNAIAKKDK